MVEKVLSEWTCEDVQEWLKTIPFGKDYIAAFLENAIEGSLLKELDDSILVEELKISKKLHRKRILLDIEKLVKAEKMSIEESKNTPDNAEDTTLQNKSEKTDTNIKSKSETADKKKMKSSKENRQREDDETPPIRKKVCKKCKTLIDFDNAMCVECDYIYPESRTARFRAVKYYKNFLTNPDYNDKRKLYEQKE